MFLWGSAITNTNNGKNTSKQLTDCFKSNKLFHSMSHQLEIFTCILWWHLYWQVCGMRLQRSTETVIIFLYSGPKKRWQGNAQCHLWQMVCHLSPATYHWHWPLMKAGILFDVNHMRGFSSHILQCYLMSFQIWPEGHLLKKTPHHQFA